VIWSVTPLLAAVLAFLPEAASGGLTRPTPAVAQAAGQPPQIDPEYTCVVCHTEMRRAFLLGVHAERGIRCHDCHGGNPRAFDRAAAHARPGFIGAPDKFQTLSLCSSCHEDPDLMRQYGLPVGQLAEFRTSRHGALLLELRDTNAPSCSDCHDSHTILPPNDARSNVYPTNITRTCGRCHEDEALMSKYGIPTDPVRLHRTSAHGTALFEQGNFAAPTCIGCHGSHAALPPKITQIADVCGHCHVLVRRAFYQGPHGSAALAGRLPGCTACHSNHGTERVRPAAIAATCTNCHASDSPEAELGVQIQEDVTQAARELAGAEEAIRQLVRHGRPVSDLRIRYQTAFTAYAQISQVQHSLDSEALEELSRQAGSISRDILAVAEVSAEGRWEHKLILIPVWFLALSAAILAWFKLRGLARVGA
jgi:hypothetical protein